MTKVKFKELLASLRVEEEGILFSKGEEYTLGDADQLANFKRVARRYNLDPLEVFGIFLEKHVDAIASYIVSRKTFSNETITGRIIDARNYLALGLALIHDLQGEDHARIKDFEKTHCPT